MFSCLVDKTKIAAISELVFSLLKHPSSIWLVDHNGQNFRVIFKSINDLRPHDYIQVILFSDGISEAADFIHELNR